MKARKWIGGVFLALLCIFIGTEAWSATVSKGRVTIAAAQQTLVFKTDRAKNVLGLTGAPVPLSQLVGVYAWSNWTSPIDLDEVPTGYNALTSYGVFNAKKKSALVTGTIAADQVAWFALLADGSLRQLDATAFTYAYERRTMKNMPKGSLFVVTQGRYPGTVQYGFYTDPPPRPEPEPDPDPTPDPEPDPDPVPEPQPPMTITLGATQQVIQFNHDTAGNLLGFKPLTPGVPEAVKVADVVKVYPYSERIATFHLKDIGALHTFLRTFAGTIDPVTLQVTVVGTCDNDQMTWWVLLKDNTLRQLDPDQFGYAYDPATMAAYSGFPIQKASTGETEDAIQYGNWMQAEVIFDGTTHNIVGWFNTNRLANLMEREHPVTENTEVCWSSFTVGSWYDSVICGWLGQDENGHPAFIIPANPEMLSQDSGTIILREPGPDGDLTALALGEWKLSPNAHILGTQSFDVHYDFTQPSN